ncbi:HNH endonuclease signature motif containing protein [Fibrobacter sp.]|uniref:HNH endonuclease n=1 Tax=Fibrobacter sp. TaxID=35828 RepID=UPI002621DC29|nr:HNH endonuclease signature motif containing protein [Fibrobacter sp.]MDD5942884.1 HNH endonuclease signature motif containing protein [Fibrobacter sp.]
MQDLNTFYDWMLRSAIKTKSTARHYKSGLSACSKDFIEWRLIDKPLTEMSLSELEVAIQKASLSSLFNEKNDRGNNMYSNSLKQYRNFLADNGALLCDSSYEQFIGETRNQTEREAIIRSRIGQGLFRRKLFEKYEGRCVVTGINDKRLLLASHVRPWSVSTNEQRLSSENGLLLSPLYDRLFDVGLIIFDDDGRIICSTELDNQNIDLLNIDRNRRYELKTTAEFINNLRYHQKIIFLGGK